MRGNNKPLCTLQLTLCVMQGKRMLQPFLATDESCQHLFWPTFPYLSLCGNCGAAGEQRQHGTAWNFGVAATFFAIIYFTALGQHAQQLSEGKDSNKRDGHADLTANVDFNTES